MWDRMTVQAAEAGADFIHQLGLRVTSGGGASIDECAELAVWLASDDSGALTGPADLGGDRRFSRATAEDPGDHGRRSVHAAAGWAGVAIVGGCRNQYSRPECD